MTTIMMMARPAADHQISVSVRKPARELTVTILHFTTERPSLVMENVVIERMENVMTLACP